MRTIFTIATFLLSCHIHSQTICGTADEGGTVDLTAPPGTVFISVTFASYGTPNGSCGSFTLGACHEPFSKEIVESFLLGNNSASIPADNGVFGDPCGGTYKRLYVQAIYSSLAPLKLLSFSGTAGTNKNILQWETANEINTHSFLVEASNDGLRFHQVAVVTAANRGGNHSYMHIDNQVAPTMFYRLKMMDNDGKFTYSNVIRLSSGPVTRLTLFPNPAVGNVAVHGLEGNGTIELLTIHGKLLQRLKVTAQVQSLPLQQYPAGLYIIKYSSGKGTRSEMLHKR